MSNIVLLRGLVREKRHWGDFPRLLKEAIPQLNIILPEIQGVGEFADMISPSNFDEMISFMRNQILEDLQNEDTIILAISLGGMIAKRWTELHPEDFSKMILLNTSFKGINPLFNRLQPSALIKFLKIFMTGSLEKREEQIVQLVSNEKDNHAGLVEDWIKIQNDAPVKKQSFVNQIRAALSFTPSKKRPQIPVMILAGIGDRLCHYKSSLKLHNIWGGSIHLHETAGHDLPSDDPQWLINKVKKFIEA